MNHEVDYDVINNTDNILNDEASNFGNDYTNNDEKISSVQAW